MTDSRRSRSAVPVLFIGGVGRSGTTLLELSLGTDPRMVTLGEVTHLWERSVRRDELCGCGLNFSACPFWTQVGERAFGGWDQVDPDRVARLRHRVDRTLRTPQLAARMGGLSWRQDLAEYAALYSRLYRAAAEVSGASVVIDSSKQASLPWVLIDNPDVDLKVLHCVRDSRAVAYSWTKVVARPESQDDSTALMHRYSPAMLAAKWVLHNMVVEALRLRRIATMRLRYEDWASDPRVQFTRVIRFAGLQPAADGPDVSTHSVELRTAHTCSGNPVRFTTGHVQVRRDDRWRSEFGSNSRRLVTALTAPFLLVYGYLGRSS